MGSHASSFATSQPIAAETSGIRAVLDSLRRIVRELRLSAREAERGAGISGAQLFVLQALSGEKASSLNALAVRTLTDQSSVSVVVRQLVDRKLVSRKEAREDARRVELRLTPAGRRMLARCPEPTQARLFGALGRMGASELDALTAGLRALVREMGIENEAPRMFFEDAADARSRKGGSTS
jgi:DNA-binding MarR family transcriptional regulator